MGISSKSLPPFAHVRRLCDISAVPLLDEKELIGRLTSALVVAGITTSLTLETVLLNLGADKLPLRAAVQTAAGMSMVSMLAMEIAENLVDYHLTGGVVALDDPKFWMAAVVSMGAGFLTPLPWNYWRLRKFGKACH